MSETIKLIEGTYEIPDGYESCWKGEQLVIKKSPEVKRGDIVHLHENYYGLLQKYDDGHAVCSPYVELRFNYFYKEGYNLVADEIRLATDEEKGHFMAILHACGKDIEYGRLIHVYSPVNPKYGVRFDNDKFIVCDINEACGLRKFDVKLDAEIYADNLSKKIKRDDN